MRYNIIPNSSLSSSVLGLGTSTLCKSSTFRQRERILNLAYELGVNHFDFANVYGDGQAEVTGGRLLQKFEREKLIIASKAFFQTGTWKSLGLGARNIRHTVDASLKNLKTDYLDIFYCHRFDPFTPLQETIFAIGELIRGRKIRFWGTSEWPIPALIVTKAICEKFNIPSPIVEQKHISLFRYGSFRKELRPCLRALEMTAVACSPLNGGRLAAAKRELSVIAKKTPFTPAQLCLAWVLKDPLVSSVLVGTVDEAHLRENLSVHSARLDRNTLLALDKLSAYP